MTGDDSGQRGRDHAGDVAFRRTAGRFATGVTVVTSLADDVPVGTTVNAFATVSLAPRLLLTCLKRPSRLLASIEVSSVFAVTVLANDQQHYARWFANPSRPTGIAAFAGAPTVPAPATGCLLLSGAAAYFDCRLRETHLAGDHTIVVGEVVSFGALQRDAPLLFVDGHFASIDQLTWAGDSFPLESGLSTPARALSVTTRR